MVIAPHAAAAGAGVWSVEIVEFDKVFKISTSLSAVRLRANFRSGCFESITSRSRSWDWQNVDRLLGCSAKWVCAIWFARGQEVVRMARSVDVGSRQVIVQELIRRARAEEGEKSGRRVEEWSRAVLAGKNPHRGPDVLMRWLAVGAGLVTALSAFALVSVVTGGKSDEVPSHPSPDLPPATSLLLTFSGSGTPSETATPSSEPVATTIRKTNTTAAEIPPDLSTSTTLSTTSTSSTIQSPPIYPPPGYPYPPNGGYYPPPGYWGRG